MTWLRSSTYLLLTSALSYNLLASDVGVAGSWSSGGGEILEHAQNPWFIKIPGIATNDPKSTINYCVEVGPDFPISRRKLETIVGESIVWWRREFSNAHMPTNKLMIGSQQRDVKVYVDTDMTFKETCDDSIDLVFQFGWLDEDQEREIERLKVDLTRYVALSIRTDYSSQLRGKGFIYVSPDRGPMAFKGSNVLPNAWTDNNIGDTRLKSVIQHELGHVFGLAHAADEGAIMDAKFPENIVDKNRWFKYLGTIQAVFFPKVQGSNHKFCIDTGTNSFDVARAVFGIKDNEQCFQTFWDLNRFSIYAEESGRRSLRGTARFTDGGKRRHKQMVSLWLPSDQTLLPSLTAGHSVLLGPASTEVLQQGEYIIPSKSGPEVKVPITVQVSPRFFQLSTVHEGNLYPDLLPKDSRGTVISGWEND